MAMFFTYLTQAILWSMVFILGAICISDWREEYDGNKRLVSNLPVPK